MVTELVEGIPTWDHELFYQNEHVQSEKTL